VRRVLDKEDILHAWLTQYSGQLLRVASSIVKDKALAEDRVQEAFIKAYYSIDQLLDSGNPFPWLVRILVNQCHSSMRRKVQEVAVASLPEGSVESAEDAFLCSSQWASIRLAIADLPDHYRLPIVLFHFEGLTIREISETLRLSPQTVKTRLCRGRDRLKAALFVQD